MLDRVSTKSRANEALSGRDRNTHVVEGADLGKDDDVLSRELLLELLDESLLLDQLLKVRVLGERHEHRNRRLVVANWNLLHKHKLVKTCIRLSAYLLK